MGNSTPPVRAIATGFDILDRLDELDAATVTELAAEVDYSKSTVHSHLETFEQLGLVVRDDWEYRISLRFFEIGTRARHAFEAFEPARAEVGRLASATGLTAGFAVFERHQCVCIHAVDRDEGGHTALEDGTVLPMHCTAPGKALLARLDGTVVEAVLETQGQPRFTDATITDPDGLREELQSVASRGVAVERGEWRDGVRGVAAPVEDDDSRLYGAVCVSGTDLLLPERRFRRDLTGLVLDSAETIEAEL